MEPSRDAAGADDDLRPEYDFSQLKGGVRGKYLHRHGASAAHGREYEQTSAPDASRHGPLNPEEAAAFVRRMYTALRPLFDRCVVPIGWYQDGKAGLWGSGTLFRVGDASLLVTASHVVTRADDAGRDLWTVDAGPDTASVPLEGRIVGHPLYDIAVWELTPAVVARLPNRTYLSVHQADRANRRPRCGTYFFYGFPHSLGAADHEARRLATKPLTGIAGVYDGGTRDLPGYDPGAHLLIDITPAGLARLDDNDTPSPVHFGGMSGCSIWQAYYEGLRSALWTPNDAAAVAVQTGVYRNGTLIRATRWWVVDRILREGFPHLSGPLSLVVP